jgi:drug/metabolite transporter (DMT)-like permease
MIKMQAGTLFIISLIVLTSLFDTISQLFLKNSINSLLPPEKSVKKILFFILKLILIPWVWLGGIFSCFSLFIWLFALSKADLNFAFSVDSMHYIFIAIASKMILKEKVGFKRWAGTIFITLGIVFVSLSH